MKGYIFSVLFVACTSAAVASGDHGQLPPSRFDHWPSVPVLVVNASMPVVDTVCGGTWVTSTKIADYVIEGCEIDASRLRALMDAILLIPRAQAKRLVAFEDATMDQPGFTLKGCVIFVPTTGHFAANGTHTDVDKHEQYMTYRHELAHCNGWSNKHEK